MNLARLGNKYLADSEPWIVIKTDKEKVGTILNVALQITANLSVIMEPFIPDSARKIAEFLNLEGLSWSDIGKTDLIKSGQTINQPSLMFEKIEDSTIDKQLEKLANIKKMNEQEAAGMEPQKETITYEEFSKMDIRIATVLEAEKVPKTTKLMKLLLDTGLDKRTVVSGISEYFKAEDMVGKQVCLLANLAPRKIRGIESHGMILLAEEPDGTLILVTPDEASSNGATVK